MSTYVVTNLHPNINRNNDTINSRTGILQANIPLIVNYTKTSLAESMQVLQVNKENSKLMSYIYKALKRNSSI